MFRSDSRLSLQPCDTKCLQIFQGSSRYKRGTLNYSLEFNFKSNFVLVLMFEEDAEHFFDVSDLYVELLIAFVPIASVVTASFKVFRITANESLN